MHSKLLIYNNYIPNASLLIIINNFDKYYPPFPQFNMEVWSGFIEITWTSLTPSIIIEETRQSLYKVESRFSHLYYLLSSGCPRGVMVKAMDGGIVESEFVLQSRYYVHFRANTLGKGMNPLILLAMR